VGGVGVGGGGGGGGAGGASEESRCDVGSGEGVRTTKENLESREKKHAENTEEQRAQRTRLGHSRRSTSGIGKRKRERSGLEVPHHQKVRMRGGRDTSQKEKTTIVETRFYKSGSNTVIRGRKERYQTLITAKRTAKKKS